MLPRTHPVQIVLFSATFPDHVRSFAAKCAPNANKIELKSNELSVDNIVQFYLDCATEDEKYDALVNLYHVLTVGQSIIFCQVSDTLFAISLDTRFILVPHNSTVILPIVSHSA